MKKRIRNAWYATKTVFRMARHLPFIWRSAYESGPAPDWVPVSYAIEHHNRASARSYFAASHSSGRAA